jgi:CO dehydrogenase/acetyl-CoA synthase beta subunit
LCRGFVFLLVFCVIDINAMRDPFSIENACYVRCDLNSLQPDDLSFVGAIKFLDHSVGLVEDPKGQVCQINTGSHLGSKNYEVVDILEDQILLSDGQQYLVIK